MQLKVHEQGAGERIAILIHGFTDDHKTWWRVAPALVDRGYQVIAPDLRGHGHSPLADDYSLSAFAGDLVDSLPRGADVIVGHSLGALALSIAADELAPKKAVYVDPPWFVEAGSVEELVVDPRAVTREQIAALAPRWIPADIAIDLASSRTMDPKVLDWVPGRVARGGELLAPRFSAIPSAVIAPEAAASFLTDEQADDLVRTGVDVFRVPESGHVIHRDNFEGFLHAFHLAVGNVPAVSTKDGL